MITILGSRLCKDCVRVLEIVEAEQRTAVYKDITKSLQNLRLYLRCRETNAALCAQLLDGDAIGIPMFILEDGTVTVDEEEGLRALRK